eukprot:2611601-Rhodomonas_salina.1
MAMEKQQASKAVVSGDARGEGGMQEGTHGRRKGQKEGERPKGTALLSHRKNTGPLCRSHAMYFRCQIEHRQALTALQFLSCFLSLSILTLDPSTRFLALSHLRFTLDSRRSTCSYLHPGHSFPPFLS